MDEVTSNRLRYALERCQWIERCLDHRSLEEYEASYGTRLQIERLLEITGTSLSRASAEDSCLRELLPDLDVVVNARDHILDDYRQIDHHRVWQTASERVPLLRQQLEAVLGELAGSETRSRMP
jgi:uncharacterized protein with HEPN domain